jgi:hypothetical protein
MVLALYLVASFGLSVAVALVQPHPDQFVLLLISLAGEILLAVLVLCIAGIRYRSSLKILGIYGSSRRNLFYYGLLGGLGTSVVLIIAIRVFFSLYRLQPEPQPVVSLIA